MITISSPIQISSSQPITIEVKDYTPQVEQALQYLTSLIAEVGEHATQNNLDLSAILNQLVTYESAVTGALNTIRSGIDIIGVSQGQIRELLSRIGGYMPQITEQIANFQSATLLNLETLGASIIRELKIESDETQVLINQSNRLLERINENLAPSDLAMVSKSFKIETIANAWTKLTVEAGAISFYLVQYIDMVNPLKKDPKDYIFNGAIYENSQQITRNPQGGMGAKTFVWDKQEAELPPNSLWTMAYTAKQELNIQLLVNNQAVPFADVLVQIPNEITQPV